jgi:hypothetical protein
LHLRARPYANIKSCLHPAASAPRQMRQHGNSLTATACAWEGARLDMRSVAYEHLTFSKMFSGGFHEPKPSAIPASVIPADACSCSTQSERTCTRVRGFRWRSQTAGKCDEVSVHMQTCSNACAHAAAHARAAVPREAVTSEVAATASEPGPEPDDLAPAALLGALRLLTTRTSSSTTAALATFSACRKEGRVTCRCEYPRLFTCTHASTHTHIHTHHSARISQEVPSIPSQQAF